MDASVGQPPGRDLWVAQLKTIRESIDNQEATILEATRRELAGIERAILLISSNMIVAAAGFELKRNRDYQSQAFILLLARAREDLLGAWTELSRGRYGCANTLLRGAYECWVALQYLSLDPSSAEGWSRAEPLDRTYDLTKMKRALLKAGQISREESDAYSILSSMTHPSAPSTFPYVVPGLVNGALAPVIHEVRPFDKGMAEHLGKCIVIVGLRLARFMIGLPGTTGPNGQFGSPIEAENTCLQIETSMALSDSLLRADPRKVYRIRVT